MTQAIKVRFTIQRGLSLKNCAYLYLQDPNGKQCNVKESFDISRCTYEYQRNNTKKIL